MAKKKNNTAKGFWLGVASSGFVSIISGIIISRTNNLFNTNIYVFSRTYADSSIHGLKRNIIFMDANSCRYSNNDIVYSNVRIDIFRN